MHAVEPMIFDADMSANIQTAMDADAFDFNTVVPTATTYDACVQNKIKTADLPGYDANKINKDSRDIYDTAESLATTAWYATIKDYDFDANAGLESSSFINMIHKTAETVGFGVSDDYVVAWYCLFDARNPDDITANVMVDGAAAAKTGKFLPAYLTAKELLNAD